MNIKEIIESQKSKIEQNYIKFLGESMIEINLKDSGEQKSVEDDSEKINNLYLMKRKKFMSIHTHPHRKNEKLSAIPSDSDLINFYIDSRRKSSLIIQRDYENGKIMGYIFLIKSNFEIPEEILDYNKKIRKKIFPEDSRQIEIYERKIKNYGNQIRKDFKNYKKELSDVLEELDFKIRFIPEKDFYFNDEIGSFEEKFI